MLLHLAKFNVLIFFTVSFLKSLSINLEACCRIDSCLLEKCVTVRIINLLKELNRSHIQSVPEFEFIISFNDLLSCRITVKYNAKHCCRRGCNMSLLIGPHYSGVNIFTKCIESLSCKRILLLFNFRSLNFRLIKYRFLIIRSLFCSTSCAHFIISFFFDCIS